MKVPQISGYDLVSVIGEGASGTVYSARKADGTFYAIKVFESMCSNPALLENRMMRVVSGGAQDVTVPIVARALDRRPACVVMPLLAEALEGGHYEPRTLQMRLRDYVQTDQSWPMILMIAESLAALHSVRVAHGNLKPGNIFLNEEGHPLLGDYAEGLMPGVHHLSYSDSLLYTSPEQLLGRDAYLDEEAGYRWDVYAFGVLAYRLLTGVFPRCHEIFHQVCPEPGKNQRFLIEADHEQIARGLLDGDEGISWPDEPVDEREARRRELLEFCLNLNPLGRPVDMRGVLRRFQQIDYDLESEELMREATTAVKTASSRRRRAHLVALLLGGLAITLGYLWISTESERQMQQAQARDELRQVKADHVEQTADLQQERDQAVQSESEALGVQKSLEQRLSSEQQLAKEELESVHLTNDRLFTWVLERGSESLPTLESRAGRLTVLKEELEKQLAGLENRPGLETYAARVRLRMGEVMLAAGEVEQGKSTIEQVVKEHEGVVTPEEEAQAALRVALIQSESEAGVSDEELGRARELSVKAWEEGRWERERAEAVLNLLLARRLQAEQKDGDALVAYEKSLDGFSKLRDAFPENLALRTQLAQGYLESARAAEGVGAMEDSAALRGKAAQEYLALKTNSGKELPEASYQIASALAAKALAEWGKGDVFEAERIARQAVKDLLAVRAKMPDDFRVLIDLSSQQGIVATSLRDEGRIDEADTLLRQSIDELQAGVQHEKMNWKARYLLSSLKWQLSSLLGQQGNREEEVRLGMEAHEELKLIYDAKPRYPRPEVVQKSLAYLCGDLGLAAFSHGQRDQSLVFFNESREYWQGLLTQGGEVAEYRAGLEWVEGHIQDLE